MAEIELDYLEVLFAVFGFSKTSSRCLLDKCYLSFRWSAQNSILEYFHAPGLVCTPQDQITFSDIVSHPGTAKACFQFPFLFPVVFPFLRCYRFPRLVFWLIIFLCCIWYTFQTPSKLNRIFPENSTLVLPCTAIQLIHITCIEYRTC